jgi:propanol-preferring alcohol dehydrogenase
MANEKNRQVVFWDNLTFSRCAILETDWRKGGADIMKAMVLTKIVDMRENKTPLEFTEWADPVPREKEIVIKVSACGICHTELDEIEGRTPPPVLPIILGHQIVGRVVQTGAKTGKYKPGERVGVGWIFSADETCGFCRAGNENLCPNFRATGRDANGGYAEYAAVPEDFAYPIPEIFSDAEAAPLLCAGAIGYRSLALTGMQNGKTLGLIGFGASAHLVIQMARHKYPDSRVMVFARTDRERKFALELGAYWAGDMGQQPPQRLDCAIDTTPVWGPILEGLKVLQPGGRLIINAIRKEEIDKNVLLHLEYPDHLWLEKEIKSVANVTRADVEDFLRLAAEIPIRPEVQEYPLEDTNQALRELKERKIRGAKVLKME